MPANSFSYGKVIGIHSALPLQGKTTIANRLVEKHGFRLLNFTRVPERMLVGFLVQIGYPEERANEIVMKDKDIHLERISGMPTARWLMKSLYEGWGKHDIANNVWSADWRLKAGTWMRSGVSVVVDGVSFRDEVETVKSIGGCLWTVGNPRKLEMGANDISTHNNTILSGFNFDVALVNDGSIGKLQVQTDAALKSVRKSGRPKKKKTESPEA